MRKKELEILTLKKMLFENIKEEKQKIEILIPRVKNFVKMDPDKKIVIFKRKFTLKEKIFLLLTVRYLASILDERISRYVTTTDIYSFESDSKKAHARISELIKENMIYRVNTGTYIINENNILPYIKKLEKKYLIEKYFNKNTIKFIVGDKN